MRYLGVWNGQTCRTYRADRYGTLMYGLFHPTKPRPTHSKLENTQTSAVRADHNMERYETRCLLAREREAKEQGDGAPHEAVHLVRLVSSFFFFFFSFLCVLSLSSSVFSSFFTSVEWGEDGQIRGSGASHETVILMCMCWFRDTTPLFQYFSFLLFSLFLLPFPINPRYAFYFFFFPFLFFFFMSSEWRERER